MSVPNPIRLEFYPTEEGFDVEVTPIGPENLLGETTLISFTETTTEMLLCAATLDSLLSIIAKQLHKKTVQTNNVIEFPKPL